MSTYELLQQLATLDEVSVTALGSMDGDLGHTPQWAEILVEITRTDDGTLKPAWPLHSVMPLRRHDGELIIEALNEVLHPHRAGAQEAIWDELDVVVVRIQRRVERDKAPRPKDAGQALGLATALSMMTGRDLEDVKDEAMQRYEESRI